MPDTAASDMSLPRVLLAYAGGLACAPYLEPSPLFAASAVAFACLWFPLRDRRRSGAICLGLFFFILGPAFYFQHAGPGTGPAHVRALVGEEPQLVEGKILTLASRPEGRTEIVLAAGRTFRAGQSAIIHGKLLLRIDRGQVAALVGDTIRFRSRLRAPRLFATPGEFDYPRHLAAQGIFATAFLSDARELAVFPTAGSFRFAALQNAAADFIDTAVAPDLAPLVRALVTGDKGGITPAQRDLLARGGLSHLFSISGLHLGLIALFLYQLGRFFYCRSERLLLWSPPRRALPLLLLPALWFYLQLTGAALPTRRAFLMALAGAVLLVICRRTSSLRILAAAALLILLAAPLALFEPSFQLSFAGVFGILLVVPYWYDRLAHLIPFCRWTATLALTTLAATVATTPLVLMHFHILAPAGLLTNLAAVPAVGFLAVPLGLLGMLALPWWPQGSAACLRGCGRVVEAMLMQAEQICAWEPLGGWQLYLTPLQTAAVFTLTAGLLLIAGSPRGRGTGGGLLLTGCLLLAIPAPAQHELTVTALSVGQGESLLISVPPGRHYLVDGGGLSASSFDVGERLLAPALGRLGVRRLEAVVLTHDHPDHRLGLLHVLKNLPVNQFWTASAPDDLDPELTTILRQRAIPVRLFPPGWTTVDAALAIFVPAQEDAGNDASLVIRAGHGGDAALLTGDLEARGVAELLAATPDASANLLKLPHHGSRKSNPHELVFRFRPQMAFASVGYGNSYRFPHDEVVALLAERHIPLYRTDRHGTLRFSSRGEGWQVECWQRGWFQAPEGEVSDAVAPVDR